MALLGSAIRVVVVALFTGVETAALAIWLGLVRDEPVASAAVALGLGVLLVGFVVEHVLTDVAVNGPSLSFPVAPVVGFSASETVLWAAWLVVAERVGGLVGVGAAGVFLAALLVPQHTVEDNVLRGAGTFSDLLDLRTLGFSVVEAAGATVWLALIVRSDLLADVALPGTSVTLTPAAVGLGVLAVALFVEHNIGVSFSRRT